MSASLQGTNQHVSCESEWSDDVIVAMSASIYRWNCTGVKWVKCLKNKIKNIYMSYSKHFNFCSSFTAHLLEYTLPRSCNPTDTIIHYFPLPQCTPPLKCILGELKISVSLDDGGSVTGDCTRPLQLSSAAPPTPRLQTHLLSLSPFPLKLWVSALLLPVADIARL